MEFLQGKSLNKENEVVLAEGALRKKLLILFYFTTIDSEACRTFDGKLKHVYQEAMKRKIELGIVVAPCDANKESYINNIRNNYFEWYSVQYGDELLNILTINFGITHVPTLIVLDKSGTIVTREGTKDIDNYGVNVLVTWLD